MPGFEFWGAEEKKQVQEVLDNGILMRYGFDAQRKGVWKAKELEAGLKQKFQVAEAQLTSSGTAALITALTTLGVGAGDEVIMPSFTFVASFEAILSVGACPVLVDVDDSLTMNPAAVEAAISPKTKCIMPVHMCGSMADMDALMDIAKAHNLILLEDACQSIGATYKGKYAGTIGDAGCFSFDFVKTITCGEGGAVITNNPDLYTKLDAYTDHGHDHLGVDRGADEHPFIGTNFRISELQAAVGVAQLKKLDEFLSIQRKNKALLKTYLEKIPQISFRKLHDTAGDNASFLSWFVPSKEMAELVVENLKNQGALAGNFYWFDNNWHYVKKWQHLKNAITLNPLNEQQAKALDKIKHQNFAASDSIISCCISTAIPLSWTPEQIAQKAEQIIQAVEKASQEKALA